MERHALRSAFVTKFGEGAVVVVDALPAGDGKTKTAVEMLRRLGAAAKTLVVDVASDETFTRAVRNIEGVRLVPCGRLTARDLMDARRVVASRAAVERLQQVLAGEAAGAQESAE